MEMERQREKAVSKQIRHRFHDYHPLVFVEDETSNRRRRCDGCQEVPSGPRYSCVKSWCNYQLHKECAEAPDSIPRHPLHPNHASGLSLRQRPMSHFKVYGCALCKTKGYVFFYECKTCYFSLDVKCALSSSSFKFNHESKPHLHQHPLTLVETPIGGFERSDCVWCHEPLKGSVYNCLECPSFLLHKKCLDELSTRMNHPSHRSHPLFLESNPNSLFCKLCQTEHDGQFYTCSLCDFHIHIECAWQSPVVEDKSRHHHPFNLYFMQEGSFLCDACDTRGHYVSYTCLTCNVTVHKGCISLPRIVKHSRHDHCLFHKYFLETKDLTTRDCNICFRRVKLERGSYSCVKQGCGYVVHVNCALEDRRFYNVVKDEKQCEELCEKLAKSLQSSITRVVEVNEYGEATMIEHFSHRHCLALAADKTSDAKCDGCMLSISTTPFYYCPQCTFSLHKTCAELPRNKPHWFRPDRVSLYSTDLRSCSFCTRPSTGFFYVIGIYHVCLRCVKVPDVIECQGHQHIIFFDDKCMYRDQCNACGVGQNCKFRCGKCDFTLDYACLTLPCSTRHKSDEHELTLTYEDGDKEQCICDVCEKERDPSHWYYHCSICDNSAHTKCVLGEFPFLKDGTTWPYDHSHHHSYLEFFRKVEGYPECSVCGRLCLEEVIKCANSTCNYIIHCKCRDEV